MDLGLAGCSVLVTGGASGIGAACVTVLAEEGARVGVLDRDPRGGEAPGIAPGAFAAVDVTDEAGVATASTRSSVRSAARAWTR
jgi:NAD(P)-dependent dehydrogenase (short-subunit alcohol dehydrogenase family)